MSQSCTISEKKWMILVSVCLGGFMATLDTSVVNIILPVLVRELETNFACIQWVTLIYLLTVTVLILVFGRLGDMIGKKTIYLTGFVVFTLGSILCSLSTNVFFLIAVRAFQGIGGAMIMALGFAIATAAFPKQERGMAMGIIGTVVSVSIVLGPVIGGLLTSWQSWRWVFIINLPIGLFGIWMVLRYVPKTIKTVHSGFDVIGSLLLFLFLSGLLLSLAFSQAGAAVSLKTALSLVLFLLALCGFIFTQRRSAAPIVDLRLFSNSTFRTGLINNFATFLSMTGSMILVAFFLQNVIGFEIRKAGLFISVIPLFMGLTSALTGRLADRYTPVAIVVIGQFILIAAYILLAFVNTEATPLEIILRFAFLGVGMGFFMPPNHALIMGSVPKSRLGIASGLMTLSRTLGQVIGVSLLSMLWVLRTRANALHPIFKDIIDASVSAKVKGFSDTMLMVSVLMGFTLFNSILNYHVIKSTDSDAQSEALP